MKTERKSSSVKILFRGWGRGWGGLEIHNLSLGRSPNSLKQEDVYKYIVKFSMDPWLQSIS